MKVHETIVSCREEAVTECAVPDEPESTEPACEFAGMIEIIMPPGEGTQSHFDLYGLWYPNWPGNHL